MHWLLRSTNNSSRELLFSTLPQLLGHLRPEKYSHSNALWPCKADFDSDKLMFSEGKGILITFFILHASVPLLIREQDVGGSSELVMWIDDLCPVQLLDSWLECVFMISAFFPLATFLVGYLVTEVSVVVMSRSDLSVTGWRSYLCAHSLSLWTGVNYSRLFSLLMLPSLHSQLYEDSSQKPSWPYDCHFSGPAAVVKLS